MKLVLASNNQGKLAEFNRYFKPLGIEVVAQANFNVKEVAETGKSFAENALIKARNACKYTDLPVIADDSGLLVDALDGQPGIYSARYAGADASDQDNINKLLLSLAGVPREQRTARFICVLALLQCDVNVTEPVYFEAEWNGFILEEPAGQAGFGYDPVFFVPEMNCSAATLQPEQKNKLSHRGKALEKLINYFKHNVCYKE